MVVISKPFLTVCDYDIEMIYTDPQFHHLG